MLSSRNTVLFVLLLSLTLFASVAIAQTDTQASCSDETKAEMPALENFHSVIYKVWHTAWPEKDTKMLADLLPEIQSLTDTLVSAPLPGILRDKQEKWNNGIADLKGIVANYKSAASPIDSVKLLEAAEKLHMQFEKLVRIIRPPLPELDNFHQTLYMLYHHYLPDKDQKQIASSVKELNAKMALLNKAKLPDRMSAKKSDFTQARKKLASSVKALNAAVKTKASDADVAAKVESMHSDYQSLEKVFE